MNKKPIETVAELIAELEKYPGDTEISHLTGNSKTSKEISSLYIAKTHPLGDRDAEDMLLLAFANNPNPFRNE
jgi:hypothetical protein